MSAYSFDRGVPVSRFGRSSEDREAAHATRLVRIDDLKREMVAALSEVMAATVTGAAPAEIETQWKNIRNGHGLHTVACCMEAAVNPRHGVAYAKAQRFVRAQMAWLDRWHPEASAHAARWCPAESERVDEWESTANDAQDAALRALSLRPTGVAEIVAKIETTQEQIIASQHVLTLDRARLALVSGGRVVA